MKYNAHKLFGIIANQVLNHPLFFVVIAAVLTILAVITIAKKFDIHSDINALMPQDAPVVQNIQKISDRMGSITTLTVYIKSPDLKPLSEEARQSQEYKDCVASLGEGEHLLRDDPPVGENWCDNPLMLYSRQFVKLISSRESVGNVRFNYDKTFFENNLLLYASNEDLEKAYEKIDETLTEARQKSGEYKACLIAADDESECDDLNPSLEKQGNEAQANNENAIDGFKEKLLERYQQTELANIREFPFYPMGNNGWLVELEIRFKKATTGLKAVQREVEQFNDLKSQIDTSLYGSDIEIEYGGGLTAMKSEYNAIVNDIARSISITILSILLLIGIFFRSVRASFRIFVPLLMSTLWSLGLTFLFIGYLNLITAFIFAILIGLGIDFGIHLYARYNLERQLGHDTPSALKISVIETGSPLFFGALTTAAAFFVLMFGSFPGFSQFGFVAGTGVLLAFITMTTVMPAFILISERILPSKVRQKKQSHPLPADKVRIVHIGMVSLTIAGIIVAICCAIKIPDIQFEGNFYNLQLKSEPVTSNSGTALETRQYVAKPRASSPTIALLDNYEQVETLSLLLTRNREYKNYHVMRRFFGKDCANIAEFIDTTFAEVMPYTGQYRSLPIMLSLVRTMPRDNGMYYELPQYAHYGREKSRALRNYRELGLRMPNTLAHLAQLAPEFFESSTVDNALPIVAAMQKQLPEWLWPAIPTQRSSQQLNTISDFASIFSYLPGTQNQQTERLATIEKIRERTADRQIRFLPDAEKQKIASFRHYLVDHTIGVDDLPEWTKLQFKESGEHPLPPRPESGVDYAFGNIALLYQTASSYQASQADVLARETRSLRIDDKPIIAATGAFVYSDMIKLVKTDGMNIAMIALLVILVIAVIQQRNPVSALIVTLPVLSGLAFTIAIMIYTDSKLGLFNIVMLPVTLGIGIDGAIYLYQRYYTLGKGSVSEAVRAVIGPVFMSSSTTLVGFGGMILSQHMGLNTMGELAIIGISTCFIATFALQPGLILIAEKLNLKMALPDHTFDPSQSSDESVNSSENAA